MSSEMKFGVCAGFDRMEEARQCGFDYLECNLTSLAQMDESEFAALLENPFPLPVLRSNCFFPGEIHLTGPRFNEEQIKAYIDHALSRGAKIGLKGAVLGSGGARNCPEGFDKEQAKAQFIAVLRMAGDAGEKYGIDIYLEPLRLKETNLVNTVSEGYEIVKKAGHNRVKLLADTHHMLAGGESWDIFSEVKDELAHVHISHTIDPQGDRDYPLPGDGQDHQATIAALRNAGYTGLISIEAGTKDFVSDGKIACAFLRKL